ncbi:MAG: alanine--tRNA ligase [bacterium]
MKSHELRKVFLEFFRQRDHKIVPSASLVPEGDPTLLFNVAGMVQFKQYYASKGALPFTRAASVQKCLRATDLDEVGRTIKHHTFFEMLGNFSFGDYFKKEAIEWAWQFITEVVQLPRERLYITVYEDDDESEEIWMRLGIDRNRIQRLGKETNFWGPAGLTGACGPCSEIHYDLGEDVGCGRKDCSPACDCGRFIEVWNLVFPQFYQEEDGYLKHLERKGVDTGMGLERLAMVCQGVRSTYETDLLKPIYTFVESSIDESKRSEVALRVITDHSRALCFAISEGVLPSNEGRGYVIRRILRRAVLRGLDLGMETPFLYKVVGKVVDVMGGVYPEIKTNAETTALVVKSDEERFEKTLERGMGIFHEIVDDLKKKGDFKISGSDVFKLYDTYGFPLEITQELARDYGLEVDLDGFKAEMENQRLKARLTSSVGREVQVGDEMTVVPVSFVGYDTVEVPTVLTNITVGGQSVNRLTEGEEGEVELERTPFYPEGGGQVSDIGAIIGENGKAMVSKVVWSSGKILHAIRVEKGSIEQNEGVVAKIDLEHRLGAQRNHTATHLLHSALRSLLGTHVRQAGSFVAPDRLRFDFTHYEPLSDEEIIQIEDLVNRKILDNLPVRTVIEPFERAKSRGAMALFDGKYGQEVRVVEIEQISCELCGGTHVESTGEIGCFRIISEGGIAAGVRRIEAVTGMAALQYSRGATSRIKNVSSILKVAPAQIELGAERIVKRIESLEDELKVLRRRIVEIEVKDAQRDVQTIKGIKLVTRRIDGADLDMLKQFADRVASSIGDAVVVVGSEINGSAVLIARVDKSVLCQTGLKASAIAKRIGEIVGGKGGGKDTFAQAGGKKVENLDNALASCVEIAKGIIR